MKVRSKISDPTRNADKLTTRQMEFIEKVRDQDIEKYRIKCSTTMNSDHRAIVWACFFSALLLLAGFTYWHLSYFYNKRETIEALRLGYEMRPREGTSVLYWSKINEENTNEKLKERRSKNRERNTLSSRSDRRDASREQSEEPTKIPTGSISISN